MNEQNPYKAPESAGELVGEDSGKIMAIARGQKIIIYSILLNLAGVMTAALVPVLSLIINLVALVVSIVGVLKLASALDFSLISKILFFISIFIPLLNILVLLMLSSRATRRLRDAGYKVGLMGAKV